MSRNRPVPFPSEEDRLRAELEQLRALVAEMRQFAAHFLQPDIVPCAENFRNAQDRARAIVAKADEVLK